MPFRRGMSRIRPVNSLKHIVDANGQLTGANQSTVDIISTVSNPADNQTNQNETSSVVNAIFLKVEVVGRISSASVNNVYMGVFKNPGGLLTSPSLDNVGTSDRRKFMIHQEMVMTQAGLTDNSLVPRVIFKGVIVIPKSYRRNGVEDKLQLVLQQKTGEVSQTTEWCMQSIYKEFR